MTKTIETEHARAKVTVTVTLRMDLPSVWGEECGLGQVYGQGRAEAENLLRLAVNAANKTPGVHMHLVSKPTISIALESAQ